VTRNERALRDAIAEWLERIRQLLPPEVGEFKLTFMARVEGNPEADIVVTQDSAAGLAEVVQRAAARDAL